MCAILTRRHSRLGVQLPLTASLGSAIDIVWLVISISYYPTTVFQNTRAYIVIITRMNIPCHNFFSTIFWPTQPCPPFLHKFQNSFCTRNHSKPVQTSSETRPVNLHAFQEERPPWPPGQTLFEARRSRYIHDYYRDVRHNPQKITLCILEIRHCAKQAKLMQTWSEPMLWRKWKKLIQRKFFKVIWNFQVLSNSLSQLFWWAEGQWCFHFQTRDIVF